MDKNREVRRGGVLGKRHVSATRRSRASTGFKYSSVISNNEDGDEMVEKSPSPNPRLQENNKERTSKKHSGRMSPSLQEVSDCWRDPERERSQSKRKRMEVQNHLSASAKEMDDNSDDNTEIGRSEDDDDLPPPTVPRRPWKLKLHGKDQSFGGHLFCLCRGPIVWRERLYVTWYEKNVVLIQTMRLEHPQCSKI